MIQKETRSQERLVAACLPSEIVMWMDSLFLACTAPLSTSVGMKETKPAPAGLVLIPRGTWWDGMLVFTLLCSENWNYCTWLLHIFSKAVKISQCFPNWKIFNILPQQWSLTFDIQSSLNQISLVCCCKGQVCTSSLVALT